MKINKKVLQKLPKVTGNEEMRQMEYVHSVIGGETKEEALKLHFPELVEDAIERAKGNQRIYNANIKKAINTLERRVTVKKMYEVAHKHAWTDFLDKKHKILSNLYDMAMDEDNSVKEREACSKTFLTNMPKFEEDKTLTIEVKDGKQEFLDRLKAMQNALHKQANENVIEAEIDDGTE